MTVASIAVRSIERYESSIPQPERLTTDPLAVVEDPSIDIVVELIGGIDPALSLVQRALELGKPVVTGNKELLAAHGPELYAAAAASGVDLLFEGAVGGGIPLIRPLRESLLGEDITRVMGIINGTTNFILSKMAAEGAAYDDVLAEAQALGYAEADPTADVGGFDAGAKAAIIASIVFGAEVTSQDVACEGITGVTADDIEHASRFGYVIKSLGVVERHNDGDGESEISVQVYPAMVPASHPLASVNDSFNAVFVEGTSVGELMFYGRGAGGGPTASAVLGDVIDAAVNKVADTSAVLSLASSVAVRPEDQLCSSYYLTVSVNDEPGVLGQVTECFGRHRVSIRSMEQHGRGQGADLYFLTHEAAHADITAVLAELDGSDDVVAIGSLMRVIGEE